MHINSTEILVTAIFGVLGFVMAYYLRRCINMILLGIFLYIAFKGLEMLKYQPDWNNFEKLVSIFQQLAKTLLALMNHMISTAGIASILLFLIGGLLGLVIHWRRQ